MLCLTSSGFLLPLPDWDLAILRIASPAGRAPCRGGPLPGGHHALSGIMPCGAPLRGAARSMANAFRAWVEQAFAKIKHWMRDAQKRSVDDTWRHLGRLIDTIEPQECRNYIRNTGYGST